MSDRMVSCVRLFAFRKDISMNNKDRKRQIAYEVLMILGSLALLTFICRLWPILLLIPIKMKYLSILYIVIIAYYFINETFMGRVNIAMSLVSFVIFYLSTKNFRKFSPKQMKRRRNYNRQVRTAKQENIGHRCVVCGRTDKDYPDLQFRYCSKCTGNKEYCQDHLFTHQHVK